MSLETQKSGIEDPGAELLDQAQSLWSRYGQTLLIAVLVVAAAGVGFYYWNAGQARQENAASEKLAQANDLFWRADYDRSRTLAQEVAKTYPNTPSGIDARNTATEP